MKRSIRLAIVLTLISSTTSLSACSCSALIKSMLDEGLITPIVDNMASDATDAIKALGKSIDKQTEAIKPAYVGVDQSDVGTKFANGMSAAIQGTVCPACTFKSSDSLADLYYKLQGGDEAGRLYILALYGQMIEKSNAQMGVQTGAILLGDEILNDAISPELRPPNPTMKEQR